MLAGNPYDTSNEFYYQDNTATAGTLFYYTIVAYDENYVQKKPFWPPLRAVPHFWTHPDDTETTDDLDSDGLPDGWEEGWYLSAGAGADTDSDGLTNLEEYEANSSVSLPGMLEMMLQNFPPAQLPDISYGDRKSTRLNSSHIPLTRMPSPA